MKKNIILIIAATLFFAACRKEADYLPYLGENSKLAYNTYTEQFQYIWRTISTGYIFWDIDTVNWDAAYDRYLPRFEALDRKYQDSGYVRTDELKNLYLGLTGAMIDHHMIVYVKNMHPAPTDAIDFFYFRPADLEAAKRDYYFENIDTEQSGLHTFLKNIASEYSVATHEYGVFNYGEGMIALHYCLFTLSDGRVVPYLWQSGAYLSPLMNDEGDASGKAVIVHWLEAICNTPRSQLAGIILDNRSNEGGYQDDLDYTIAPFINQRQEIFKTRYKEGPGRLEYSAWSPYYLGPNPVYHRDITADNIPYVILCDINSCSMGEIEPLCAKLFLPTAHTIGERTKGALGCLQVDAFNLTHGGTIGNIDRDNHFIFTPTFETQIGGRVREGEGVIPDEEIHRIDDPTHSFKPQFDAALNFIKNY